jgi:hypothetical protein
MGKAVNPTPYCIEVEPLPDYRLFVRFDNGEKRVFDVKPYFKFKQFEELRINALFKTVKPAGLSIEWLHGQDICPDELYYLSENALDWRIENEKQ